MNNIFNEIINFLISIIVMPIAHFFYTYLYFPLFENLKAELVTYCSFLYKKTFFVNNTWQYIGPLLLNSPWPTWWGDPASIYMFSLINVHNYAMMWITFIFFFVLYALFSCLYNFIYIPSIKSDRWNTFFFGARIMFLVEKLGLFYNFFLKVYKKSYLLKDIYFHAYILKNLLNVNLDKGSLHRYYADLVHELIDLKDLEKMSSWKTFAKDYLNGLDQSEITHQLNSNFPEFVFQMSKPVYSKTSFIYWIPSYISLLKNITGSYSSSTLKHIDYNSNFAINDGVDYSNTLDHYKLDSKYFFTLLFPAESYSHYNFKGISNKNRKLILKNKNFSIFRLRSSWNTDNLISILKAQYSYTTRFTNAVFYYSNFESSSQILKSLNYKYFTGILPKSREMAFTEWFDKASSKYNTGKPEMWAKLSETFTSNLNILWTKYSMHYYTSAPLGWANLYNKQMILFNFLDQQWFEYVWSFIPSIIIFQILTPSLILLYSLEDTNLKPLFNIKIIGHQWYWEYEFDNWFKTVIKNLKTNKDTSVQSNFLVKFDSNLVGTDSLVKGEKRLLTVDNSLILPTNVPLRLLITSADVLHSWAVPELGVKVDAVPGRINNNLLFILKPGMYYGQCSELCGVQHGFMPIVVKAVKQEAFVKFYCNKFSLS